jgi:hypothetical protein
MDLQSGLARPIEQRLGCSRLIGIETFGGSEQGEKRQRHDAASRPAAVHQSTNRLLMRSEGASKCPRHSPALPLAPATFSHGSSAGGRSR